MKIDDETFFAWLDGELDGAAADKVAAAVAADPVLAGKAQAHRAMRTRLRAAFDPVMTSAVSDSIGAPVVVDLAAVRERRAKSIGGVPQWAAMAATLVLGLGLGTVASQRGGDAPVAVEAGQMVAAAGLRDALDTQLASAPVGAGPRIGLTFRTADGALCRSFSGATGASGLACRANGEWQLRGLFGGEPGNSGTYRMAAGEDPRLAALIDDSIAGEPFDAAAERKARDAGWR